MGRREGVLGGLSLLDGSHRDRDRFEKYRRFTWKMTGFWKYASDQAKGAGRTWIGLNRRMEIETDIVKLLRAQTI